MIKRLIHLATLSSPAAFHAACNCNMVPFTLRLCKHARLWPAVEFLMSARDHLIECTGIALSVAENEL